MERTTTPLFSLVVPVHNVEDDLPAFLASLAGQSQPLGNCQLIFVDDGSTDSSVELIRSWITGSGVNAEVVEQPNRGTSAARNAGLERAVGEWVTFPNPDDVLDAHYLEEVQAFLLARGDIPEVISTHRVPFDDETGLGPDIHPRRTRSRKGTDVVNLLASPERIHRSAASGFYRRRRVEELGLRFNDVFTSAFEDPSFTTICLMESPAPRVGIVAGAIYGQRTHSSAAARERRSWLVEDTYTTMLEHGYLRLLRQIAERYGAVPRWVQNLVLDDLLAYFRTDQQPRGATAAALPAWTERFHVLAEEILCFIDVETIDGFSVTPTSQQLRAALIVGYKKLRLVPEAVRVDGRDVDQQLVRMRYFCGPVPEERIWLDGRPAHPAYAKTRDVVYLDRVLMHERIVWLSAAGEVALSLDGQRVPVHEPAHQQARDGGATAALVRRLRRWPARAVRMLRRASSRFARRAKHAPRRRVGSRLFSGLSPAQEARIKRAAASPSVRRRYADAWVFIDRDTEAHDNAEHLFRHVRRTRPDVNAWFVLRRESFDWSRLSAEGFRLIAFGSVEHALVLLNATHVISSQIDEYVTDPLDRSRFGERPWRLTFLQHGVIHTDLSRWLNSKPFDRLITSSSVEHAGIVDDHTPYVFTEKEVRLTGLPRHDRLLELSRAAARPSCMLIAPTWRGSLMKRTTAGNALVLRAPLVSTTFWQAWIDLISSPELKGVAEDAHMEIAFVPHPKLQPHIVADDLPPWVTLHRFGESDIQALLARAAVTITDYSSLAFEAAYVGCPVVYYQFEEESFFGGTHFGRRGTWDYVSHGFGPVTYSTDGAVDAVRQALDSRPPNEPYRSRMRAAFAHRDGRCCERTIESILALTRPATHDASIGLARDGQHPDPRAPGSP